jgi:hypothetical protein
MIAAGAEDEIAAAIAVRVLVSLDYRAVVRCRIAQENPKKRRA